MISEVVIPFLEEGMENTLVEYRNFQNGYGDEFLVIRDRIYWGQYPIDTDIDIVTDVGLNIGAGDSITIEMKTMMWV